MFYLNLSGEEGTYLELEKCCEEKLRKLHPNSRALRKPCPLLNLSDINKEERKDIEDDLQNWTANMATLDDTLKNMASKEIYSQDKPPIRCPDNLKAESEKSEKKKPPPVSKKPVMPRGYKEWDKFDIEKELKGTDEKAEEKKKSKNANSNISETVSVKPDTLEDTKQVMAAREKDKGNEAFRSGDYNEAVIYYNRSLSICPSDVVYNNRSLVYLKLHNWDASVKDCNMVLENDKNNIKALLRRATAYKEKEEYNKSLYDLKQVLVLEPENQRAKQILQEVECKCTASTKNETETVPKKKKGRKLVIEEVEGSEEDELAKLKDKNQMTSLPNGLPDQSGGTKALDKSDEKSEDVSLGDTMKSKGDGHSGKASKHKKNIKNKLDAKSSMSGDNCLSNKDKCPASSVKHGEASGAAPVNTGQVTTTEKSESKKDSKESASISCDKNVKTTEILTNTPKVLMHWPLPSRVELVKKSGNDMFQKGRYAEALKFYTNAIDMLQEKSDEQTVNLSLIYSNRAACCLKMGNCQGSIKDCTFSLDLVPHAIKPLLRRAAAYETLERYGLAYIDYKHVLAIDSSVEVAQQGSSRCSQTLIQLQGYSWREKLPPLVTVQASDIPVIQKPPGAETTAAHHPDSEKPKLNTKSGEDEIKTSKSSKKSQKKLEKQNSAAEKQGSTPEKKAPKTLTKEEEFDTMKSKGNQHVKNEEYQKAIECYTKCVQLFPDKVVSYTNRALCYLKLNQANKAESDCDKSLKKEPGNIKAMFRRAQAKKLKQHYRESISDLKNLLTMDPKNSAAKKELEVVKNFWRQELNAMKASMGEGKSKKDSNKCNQESNPVPPAPSGGANGSGKKGSKQRTRVCVHDVDEDNNSSSSSSSSSQSKSPSVPVTKSHGKHHKNSAPKKAEGNTQQNQAPSNNKKGCKSGGRTAPPPPVAAPHIDKATPYEFLKAWNSLKTVRNTKPYADLLAQVPPEDLPKMISNKLDAAMLNLITRCVSEHYADRGTAELGLQILSNVTKVERFQTIAMFMSSKEKSDLLSLLETLAANQTLYGEEEMQKLKHEYGLK